MLLTILYALPLVIAIILVIAALRPAGFRVARSAAMTASPAALFPCVNDLHRFQEWSPWARMDPKAKTSFEGPPAGPGAIFRWDGNNQVGAGAMTLTENRPNEFIRFRMDFLKPFAGTNIVEFSFTSEGSRTVVAWTMTGKYHFMVKVIGLFMNCDKMVGGQFEQGLANLKALAETTPRSS